MSDHSSRLRYSADWLDHSVAPSVVPIRTLGSQFLALRRDQAQAIPLIHIDAQYVASEVRNTEPRNRLPH